jgi:uncharacterized protein (DUF488 family)
MTDISRGHINMKIYTIGFTKKSAEEFFALIRSNDISRIIDVRLNNVSQLAGFTKKDDLKFFLRELCDVGYLHLPDMAPTKDILNDYKKKIISWDIYEERFNNLMIARNIENKIDKSILENGCLLCSEHKPNHCHRRLIVEYLNKHLETGLEIKHL